MHVKHPVLEVRSHLELLGKTSLIDRFPSLGLFPRRARQSLVVPPTRPLPQLMFFLAIPFLNFADKSVAIPSDLP